MNKTLPIWRNANRLLLDIENSVRHWPRYHKYTLGAEMRVQAMQVCRLISRAWRARRDTLRHLHALVVAECKLMSAGVVEPVHLPLQYRLF